MSAAGQARVALSSPREHPRRSEAALPVAATKAVHEEVVALETDSSSHVGSAQSLAAAAAKAEDTADMAATNVTPQAKPGDEETDAKEEEQEEEEEHGAAPTRELVAERPIGVEDDVFPEERAGTMDAAAVSSGEDDSTVELAVPSDSFGTTGAPAKALAAEKKASEWLAEQADDNASTVTGGQSDCDDDDTCGNDGLLEQEDNDSFNNSQGPLAESDAVVGAGALAESDAVVGAVSSAVDLAVSQAKEEDEEEEGEEAIKCSSIVNVDDTAGASPTCSTYSSKSVAQVFEAASSQQVADQGGLENVSGAHDSGTYMYVQLAGISTGLPLGLSIGFL